MPIDWRPLPADRAEKPYDGELCLLAVPHWIGTTKSELDADYPWSFFIGAWNEAEGLWMTSESEDGNKESYNLAAESPLFWSNLNRPTFPQAGIARLHSV